MQEYYTSLSLKQKQKLLHGFTKMKPPSAGRAAVAVL
jgi:hypothetical protein